MYISVAILGFKLPSVIYMNRKRTWRSTASWRHIHIKLMLDQVQLTHVKYCANLDWTYNKHRFSDHSRKLELLKTHVGYRKPSANGTMKAALKANTGAKLISQMSECFAKSLCDVHL